MTVNPSPPDWRGLCEELVDALAFHVRHTRRIHYSETVLDRARALLAQPEPEVVGPELDCEQIDVPPWHRGDSFHVYREAFAAGWARGVSDTSACQGSHVDTDHTASDRDMLEAFYAACRSEGGTADEIHLRGLHAILARFGRPAPPQPEPEVVGPSDEQILAAVRHLYGDQTAADMGAEDDLRTVRAFLANFDGRPAPAPAGEAADLVATLLQISDGASACDDEETSWTTARAAKLLQRLDLYEKELSAVMPSDFKDWWENSKDEWPSVAARVIESLRRREEWALEQLGSQAAAVAVPVSERLPSLKQISDWVDKCRRDFQQNRWTREINDNDAIAIANAALYDWATNALPLPSGEVE